MLSLVARYGIAIAAFGLTLGLSTLLSSSGIKLNLTIPIVLAMVATAWYGGLGPGILLSILFQTTTIIYVKPPPDSNPYIVWFGHFSIFALYIFLTLVMSRLRSVQTTLREQRDLLQVTLSSIGDAVVTTDTSGTLTFLNPAAQKLTGWTNDTALGNDLRNVVNLISEGSRESVEDPVSKVLATGEPQDLTNHTILVSRDGREIPVDDRAAPLLDNERIRGVVMVLSDVTERKRAERSRREKLTMQRVVEAQESERHRIARDLHDHLGQKMTSLRLRIQALADDCGEYKGIKDAIADVQRSALNIDRDISFLSWELRPTELEELGLIDALSSYVREWSKQHEIQAEFQTSGIGDEEIVHRFPETIETNLYRVVQEALNNILKHARADSVSVLLQKKRDLMLLIVEDDGAGFEDQIHTSTGASRNGLGLIGMRERAALIGGTLDIESSEGSGTSVILKVPVSNLAETT